MWSRLSLKHLEISSRTLHKIIQTLWFQLQMKTCLIFLLHFHIFISQLTLWTAELKQTNKIKKYMFNSWWITNKLWTFGKETY